MLVGTMLFTVIFFTLFLIAFLIVLPFWIKEHKKNGNYNHQNFNLLIAGSMLGLALVMLIMTALPFNSKFWVYTAETSTISSIENKVVTSGDNDSTSLTSEFVLMLEGDTVPVVLTDSRIQTYEAGDTISLNCSYEWVYAGMEVKNCKILG